MTNSRLFVAIPAMDELPYLPLTLHDLARQNTTLPVETYVCVNQPETYWNIPDKRNIALRNRQLLEWLQSYREMPVHVLDRTSQGKGWTGKNFGVGQARKVLFDTILQIAGENDILVSLDADTHIRPAYLQSISDTFSTHPHLRALSVPYYHPLSGDETCDRAMLRYELYMRNYSLNMYHIHCPYRFTAIGSAMAFKASALRQIGGIAPMKSGEDFYLMQKLCKMTAIGQYNAEAVYPATRYSDRVLFGTGPAMLKGSHGQWKAYPIYHHSLFEAIATTYQVLPQLYKEDVHTDFLDFLQAQSGKTDSIWQPIRQNMKDLPHFIQAFHEKADGLRILQYLRQRQVRYAMPDEKSLQDNIRFFFSTVETMPCDDTFSFSQCTVKQLNQLRDVFFDREMILRKAEMADL